MPQLPDSLIVTPAERLAYVSSFVNERALVGIDTEWAEVTREFGDERNYLWVYLATKPGARGPSVHIEFGVHDPQTRERRAAGGFVAGWSPGERCVTDLDVVLLDGEMASLARFVDRLSQFAELPQTAAETVERMH